MPKETIARAGMRVSVESAFGGGRLGGVAWR